MGTAWLMMATGVDREHAGNEGYDDDPARYYSWDSTVANRDRPKDGDFIVLWDKRVLLGWSVIQNIKEWDTTKTRLRCPECERTALKVRKKVRPRYRCHRRDCLHEFDEPRQEDIPVHAYRSEHAAGWVDLGHVDVDRAALTGACVRPKSMHSIRELDWSRFSGLLGGTEDETEGGQGRSSSPELNSAIELHAVLKARVYFERKEYSVEEHGKPFDLLCEKDGRKLYVEVKGTRSAGSKVTLTYNEVELAKDEEKESVLFVQYSVSIEETQGGIRASGGQSHVLWPWHPSDDDLKIETYGYSVPGLEDGN